MIISVIIKNCPDKRYESRPAIQVSGEFLPFDQMAVLHGTFHVDDLKKRSKEVGVSITKYLAAAFCGPSSRPRQTEKR